MPRIAGIDIPAKKRIEIALTYIFGIGVVAARDILLKAQIDVNKRAQELSDAELAKIRTVIDEEYKVEGDLRRERSMNIKRLIELNAYRGIRHRSSLPLRGQRTHTNARTRKGRQRVAVAGKKKAPTSK
jgi:small subunit ribosomal protein S13